MARLGIEAEGRPYLASMGIYLFNRATLVDILASSNATDFGKELFPRRSRLTGSRPTSSTATGKTSAPSAPSTRRTST